ncbi:MAG: hypothetical protein ACM3PF_05640 [Bacteroidota bacterium]
MKAALLLLLLLPAAALAQGSQTGAAPAYQVILASGDTLQASCVQPAPFDMVCITTTGSETRYVSASRIRAVTDAGGADVTSLVVDHRKTLGMPPVPPVSRPRQPRGVGDRSITRAFLITEATLLGRIHPGGLGSHGRAFWLGFDAGVLENVSDRTGIGYGMYFGSGGDYADLGIRLRLRRWLTPTSNVEIAPGVTLAEHRVESGDPLPPFFSLQASWSPSRYVTLTAESYTLRRREYLYGEAMRPVGSEDVRETGILVGFKVGQWPGAAAGLVAALPALFVGSIHANP